MQQVTNDFKTASRADSQEVDVRVDITFADSRHVSNPAISSTSETWGAQILRLSPHLWWRNDDTTPYDYSGNGFSGDWSLGSTAPDLASGPTRVGPSSALSFVNGVFTIDEVVLNRNFTFDSANLTAIQFLNWDDPATADAMFPMFSTIDGSPSNTIFSLGNYAGNYNLQVCDGSTLHNIATTAAIPSGWHMVALVISGTTWKVLIDGVTADSGVWAGGLNTVSSPSFTYFLQGVYFDGDIADTVIFDYVLTDKQIESLFLAHENTSTSLLVDEWFSPEQLINGVENEGIAWCVTDALKSNGKPITANGDTFVMPSDPVDGQEYGFYTREKSDGSGNIAGTEAVYVEFDQRKANFVKFVTSNYLGRVKTATLYYKDTSDVWQSHSASLTSSEFEYSWDLGGDIDIRGVGVAVTSTHNPNDFGRVHEIVPLFKKSFTEDDYVVSMDIQLSRENLEGSIPIGNSVANTFTLVLDNTEKVFNPDGAGAYAEYMISDIKIEPFIGYADVPGEMIQKGIFYADDINTDGESMQVSISCRDYSKYLQSAILESGVFFSNETVGNAISRLAQLYGVPSHKVSFYDNLFETYKILSPKALWRMDDPYVFEEVLGSYEEAFQSLRLDGSTSYASTTYAAADDMEKNFTVEFDVAADDWTPSADQYILGKWHDTPAGDNVFSVVLTSAGKLRLYISSDGTSSSYWETTDPLGFDNFNRHKIRITRYNGMAIFSKYDGDSLTRIEKVTGGSTSTLNNSSIATTIGTHQGASSKFFKGNIYAARIWNGTDVPADEDNALEEATLSVAVDFEDTEDFVLGASSGDSELDGRTYTFSGNASLVTVFDDFIGENDAFGFISDPDTIEVGADRIIDGYVKHATAFNDPADGDGIKLFDTSDFSSLDTEFTLSGFIKISAVPDENERILSWADSSSATGAKTFDLMIDTSRRLRLEMRDAGNANSVAHVSADTVTVDQSTFFAVTYDSATGVSNIWTDTSKDTLTSVGFGTLYKNAATPIAIGCHSIDDTVVFEGVLQNIAIFDYVLDDDQISDLYVASSLPEVDVYPYLYGIEASVWDTMVEWSIADVGVFYFDETGTLIYEYRPTLTEQSLTRHAVSQHTLSDDVDIISGERVAQVQANKIVVNVNPISKINSGVQGVWRADSGESLIVTKLAQSFDKYEVDSVKVASTDEPLWLDSGYFKIDDEIIGYNSKSGRYLKDLERGLFGTSRADHGSVVADFEDGTIENAEVFRNCTLSNSSVQAYAGSSSLKVEVNEETDDTDRWKFHGPSGKKAWPVSNDTVTMSAQIYAETAAREVQIGVSWYKKNGDLISTSWGTASNSTLGGWKSYTASGTRPKKGYYATWTVRSADSELNDVFYVDSIQLSGGVRPKVREVRVYDIEYSSQPVVNVKPPFITAVLFDDTVEIEKADLNEFGGQIILSVKDNVEYGATVILEGTDPVTEIDNFFVISGIPLVEDSGSDEVEVIDTSTNSSIRLHGEQELVIDNRFIQSDVLAKKIADYLLEHYKNPVPILNLVILGAPYLQLGDRIDVSAYDQLDLAGQEFWIIEQTISYDGGLNHSLILREVS